jgi:Tol biopolymer transport system component
MKRFRNVLGGVLGLVGLGVLAVVLTLVFSTLKDKQTPEVSLSPLESPTPSERSTAEPSPTATPMDETFRSPLPTPTETPTLPPTSTRPPEPPTRAPTPTYTPAPPTPTPEPLPTLIPGLQTIVYATTGDKGPEIHRAQVNETGIAAGSIHLVHTADLWRDRTYLLGLHPSPDGRQIAVSWAYGDVGSYILILDVNTGKVTRLIDDEAWMNQSARFLDWSPDSGTVLALVGGGNPDLGWGVWLVSIATHRYEEIEAIQRTVGVEIDSASFSPDGKEIIYAQSGCYQCGSEVRRLTLGERESQLLFRDPEFKVEDVLWSPDGRHLAFTQWQESTDFQDFALGELWVMNADGSEGRLLSRAVTGHYGYFVPAWSRDSQQIAFIQGSGSGKDLVGLSSNAYTVDIQSGAIKELTSFQNVQVLKPIWSPDGSGVAFAASQSDPLSQFEIWVAASDGDDLRPIDTSAALTMDSRKSKPVFVWLTAPGSER